MVVDIDDFNVFMAAINKNSPIFSGYTEAVDTEMARF